MFPACSLPLLILLAPTGSVVLSQAEETTHEQHRAVARELTTPCALPESVDACVARAVAAAAVSAGETAEPRVVAATYEKRATAEVDDAIVQRTFASNEEVSSWLRSLEAEGHRVYLQEITAIPRVEGCVIIVTVSRSEAASPTRHARVELRLAGRLSPIEFGAWEETLWHQGVALRRYAVADGKGPTRGLSVS